MRLFVTLFCFLFLSAASARAADFHDWRDGDLIFQNSGRGQSAAVLAATGSVYTHVGMIKLTPKGPVVVEAVGPVKETPLKNFLARGEGGHYAVYRVKNLPRAKALQALAEARKYYGRPYDPFFRPDLERIYCSELVWLAFMPTGYKLGKEMPFKALNIDNAAVRAVFASRWHDHPDRKAAKSAAACWAIMEKQPIVTPASLVADNGAVQKLFSSFGSAEAAGPSVFDMLRHYVSRAMR